MDKPTRVGFWGVNRPATQVWDPADRTAVLAHLRAGRACATCLGFSWCRFQCGTPDIAMGSRDLTDGRYVWPEGLAHYVERHDVTLPPAFVRHALVARGVVAPAPGTPCRCGRCDAPADALPEREGYCARCFPVCAPASSGRPRFPLLAELAHASPEALEAGALALSGGATLAGHALAGVADLIRKNHGLPAPKKRGPRGAYRRRA